MKPLKRSKIKKLMQKYQASVSDVELVFLLQNFENAVNVGHMFRIADALSAKELIITGHTHLPDQVLPTNSSEYDASKLQKMYSKDVLITSMGQENRMPYRYFSRPEDAVKTLKTEGFAIISVELTENSILYTELKYPKKVCLVLGNETKGVYPSVLSSSDHIVHIPMYGKNYSLNVHISGALVGYEVRKIGEDD